MALGAAAKQDGAIAETVRQAAAAVGADLLFVLPVLPGDGLTAVVRMAEGDQSRILQVRMAEGAPAVTEEPEIDADLLGFARATIDVLERLRDDRRVLEPLAAPAH